MYIQMTQCINTSGMIHSPSAPDDGDGLMYANGC